jgi:glutamyl-tRNA reductase
MNHLIVSGLNYHSSPLAIRERFTIPPSCLKHALHALARMPHIKEAAVLSTCNRTEVYAVVSDVQAGLHEIDSFFLSTQTVADHEVLKPNFRLLREDVVLHLFRVASGLDSMVLGEGQIMSQVKEAYSEALSAQTAGPIVDQLFKLALNCGKRVRSETSMGRRAVSVSSAAVELAREILGPLGNRTICVIGAGKMGKVCVKHLLNDAGKGPVVVLNRSPEAIGTLLENNLANKHRLKTGFTLDDTTAIVSSADLVIVSTSAPNHIVTPENIALSDSKKELCIIDISVPRNVDPACGDIPGVRLFHADDLSSIVNRNLSEREALVSEAESIIFESLDGFHNWQRSLLVAPTITELREKIESIRLAHMQKSLQSESLDSADQDHQDQKNIEEISRAIVNQILHHPTIQLKATKDYQVLRQQAEALRMLFNLDPSRNNKSQSFQASPQAAASRSGLQSMPESIPAGSLPLGSIPTGCPMHAMAQKGSAEMEMGALESTAGLTAELTADRFMQMDKETRDSLKDFSQALKESLMQLS